MKKHSKNLIVIVMLLSFQMILIGVKNKRLFEGDRFAVAEDKSIL